MSEKRLAGGREIVLPMSKAVEISFRSLKIRFGRSLITTSGVILAIAFLMSVWSSNAIVGSLRDVNKSEINLLLQKNGIETGLAESGEASSEAQARMLEEESKQTWLISLSLLVCVVGIANAMLMSVTERFREIGTMKGFGLLYRQALPARIDLPGFCGDHGGDHNWFCADLFVGVVGLWRLCLGLLSAEQYC